MKKLVLLISAIIISIGVSAQKGKVQSALSFIDQGSLDKAKEAIDQALVDEKTVEYAKTYFVVGKLAMASFESENPKFKTLYKNPLQEAYTAFEKAMALDPKGGTTKSLQVSSTYLLLGNMFINQAVAQFGEQKFDLALESFKNNIKISQSEVYVGVLDTGVIFNAGLAAYNAKKYAEAIGFFETCTKTNYEDHLPYQYMVQAYRELGDLDSAEKLLNKAFETFPGNKDILLTMIQFYLDNGLTDNAFKYIQLALEKDPNDYSLYLAQGWIHLKSEKYEDAVKSLEKAVELNENDFAAQFNLGISYYSIAFEMYLKSNEIMDVKKYNEATAEVDAVFAKAVKPLEKALELDPVHIDTMKTLKELYYRLKMMEKHADITAKLDAIIKK